MMSILILLYHQINKSQQSYNGTIQKGLVDPEELQATLGDESLAKGSDLKKALEMVALLEAQMKEMMVGMMIGLCLRC
nr:structural maintenance of chromosomes protein 4 [Tanacetum cinerariifolium]